jgi:hypothetical protein
MNEDYKIFKHPNICSHDDAMYPKVDYMEQCLLCTCKIILLIVSGGNLFCLIKYKSGLYKNEL